MLHVQKHNSYEIPPNVPYFKRSSVSVDQTCTGATHTVQTPISSGLMSPGKRVTMRTECMDQLKKWHELLVDGVISQSDYDRVQQEILKDMM